MPGAPMDHLAASAVVDWGNHLASVGLEGNHPVSAVPDNHYHLDRSDHIVVDHCEDRLDPVPDLGNRLLSPDPGSHRLARYGIRLKFGLQDPASPVRFLAVCQPVEGLVAVAPC